MGSRIAKIAFIASLALLANSADAGKPKSKSKAKPASVQPIPSPPPPVVYIPPRPVPPFGAAPTSTIPPKTAAGLYQTINTGVSRNQMLWNFRSAYNVAALNCMKPEHAGILAGYKLFLKRHKVGLAQANTAVNSEFRKRYGASFVRPREKYMTQVYNFYAFPPTLNNFCDVALAVAIESKTVKPAKLATFATRSLTTLDGVFEAFYLSFEKYSVEAAAWDEKYAPRSATAAPAAAASGT